MRLVRISSLFSYLNSNTITDNTNKSNLELYTVIGEVDNAGYPLAYCLLTSATAIVKKKRQSTLAGFLGRVKETYDLHPRFAQVDKDFAEIAALREVWPSAKIQVCWWHMKRALQE